MNTILGLDIGTEYVKTVLARVSKTNALEILSVATKPQRPGAMCAGAITDIASVVATSEEAIMAIEDASRERATTAVIGIAGELIKGNTTTVNYTREHPDSPITEQEVSEIIKKVQEKAGLIARNDVAIETGNKNVEVRLINSAIVSLTIDGYKIMNPIGFKGADVHILIYTAFAPLLHIAAIEKVSAELNLDLLTIAVEPFAICRACLGDNLDASYSGIIMDVGSGTTDVAVIVDGSIAGTATFSIGGRQLMKDLESTLPVWTTGVEVALEEFSPSISLPRNIYLCGGGASYGELQEALALGDWYKSLPFSRRPVIHLLDVRSFPGITARNSVELTSTYATALGLARVGADTLEATPEEHGLRAKFSKLLQN